jgi:ADP-ribose pyrophosphatase YjhB (NUDIX family)
MEYYHDVTAPQAQGLLLAAYAIVCNHLSQVLLVRRTDDSNWELPGGRVEVGETASQAAVREVAEESGVTIEITDLAGIYSDPAHVLVYPDEKGIYQQFAVCFYATTPARDAHPDGVETSAAAWFDPHHTTHLAMHPAMRQRLTNALNKTHHAYFD